MDEGWQSFIPDPLPPGVPKLGGALRERSPSLHGAMESIHAQHQEAKECARTLQLAWELFYKMSCALPEEVAHELCTEPTPERSQESTLSALRFVTRSSRWRLQADPREHLVWPAYEIYEFSESLAERAKNDLISADEREAARAAYELFLQVSIGLFKQFERVPKRLI